MDTGEHVAIDAPFTEAVKSYRQLQEKLHRIANMAIQHTKAIHHQYHRKVRGGWKACRMGICRHTQMMCIIEGIDIDSSEC